MKYARFIVSTLCLLPLVAIVAGADWSRFRGPDGLGISDETGLPTQWSEKSNLAWRTELPGPGTSSPVTSGDRVFLTCYSGYALSAEDPGDKSKLMRHVVCIDRSGGSILWRKDLPAGEGESDYSGNNNTWHGYASSTPAVEDGRLYVFFGRSGVFCFDVKDGRQLWHADVGNKATGWGSGNSLLIHQNLVIVNASIESESLRALDKTTGKEVWSVHGVRGARNTPNLVKTAEGETELVLSLPGKPEGTIVAYDPRDGRELWHCRGIPDQGYTCPSVVAHDGVVYAIGGRKNTALAVRAGGRGDVTKTHELWRADKGSNVASPVYYQGHLYWVHERQGIAYCLNAKTGEVVYEQRLDPRPGTMYSSITIADGKIYAPSQHSGVYVLAAQPQFKLLAHNVFADDDSRTNASPVVSRGQLLLRNDRYLYCIGVK